MNCDQAFDQMTDLALSDRSELQQHLVRCARCRQMQEILSPAISAFSESEESSGSPEPTSSNAEHVSRSYADSPWLSPDSVQIAEQNAKQLMYRVRSSKRRSHSRLAALRYAAAMFVGALIAYGLGGAWFENESDEFSGRAASNIENCHWLHQGSTVLPVRQEHSASQLVASCVHCHSGTMMPKAQSVTLKCVACHLNLPNHALGIRSPADTEGGVLGRGEAVSLSDCLWQQARG